jgi:hypothetical protein
MLSPASIVDRPAAAHRFGEVGPGGLSEGGHLPIFCTSTPTGIRHNIAQERQQQEVLGACTTALESIAQSVPRQAYATTLLSPAKAK